MNMATVKYHDNHQNQIAIPIRPRPAANLPRLDLLTEDCSVCDAFQSAIFDRDWEAAEAILHQNPELIMCAINLDLDTPLHFALYYAASNKFVENLVNLINEEDLELQSKSYKTALSLSAAYRNVEIAKILLKKNKSLLEIPDIEGMMPLHVAAMHSNTNMVRHLYDKSNKMNTDSWTPDNRGLVLHRCVENHQFDFAVQILNDYPELTSNTRLLSDVLLHLVENTNLLKEKQPHTISRSIKSMFHVKVGRDEGESDSLKLLRTIKEKIARMRIHDIMDILKGPPLEIGEGQHKKTTYPDYFLLLQKAVTQDLYSSSFNHIYQIQM